MVMEQSSRRDWASASNAFMRLLSTSMVPMTVLPDALKMGTMISDFVEPSAVRYRESLATLPTVIDLRSVIAALVKPFVMGNTGCSGAPGPLQAILRTR